jgi:hypothetical protein
VPNTSGKPFWHALLDVPNISFLSWHQNYAKIGATTDGEMVLLRGGGRGGKGKGLL